MTGCNSPSFPKQSLDEACNTSPGLLLISVSPDTQTIKAGAIIISSNLVGEDELGQYWKRERDKRYSHYLCVTLSHGQSVG